MEIVFAFAAVVGISLITVPRLRRRSRGRVRADAGKQWTTAAAARRRRHPAAGDAAARSGWSSRRTAVSAGGTTMASALATEPYDEWDDDLDWGGETAVASPPAGPPAPLPATDLDWQLPGENGRVAEPDPAAEPATDEREPVAAEAPDEPAEPDWDWEPVASRRPQPAAAPAGLAPPPVAARTRGGRIRAGGRKVNPLVLVALYAAFGIGVIVIAVTVVSGAVSGPDTNRTPRTSATVASTPRAASGTANAEAKRLQQAFLDQRGAVVAQETAAVRDARAAARRARAARRKARAARRRAAARRAARRPTPARQAPVAPAPVTPVAPVTPAPSGGGGGGGGCEFCLE